MSPRTLAFLYVVLLPAKLALCSKGSLTIVMDHTHSMGKEIKAVAEAASAIARKIFNISESPVDNVIVTLFEDPVVHPPVKFTSFGPLLEKLNSSTRNLEGDSTCPEMSMTGTRDGLLASNPNSYVYVFTDDVAKDKNLTQEVIDLCQKYGHQIVYIITPHRRRCEESFVHNVNYYYKVAEFCLGQVFKLKESELDQVLAYVEETVSSQRTVLTSKVIKNNAFHPENIPFTLDDEVEYGIVSVSGGSVQLTFPETPTNDTSYEKITWLRHIKVAKITTPGDYVARVWGGSTVSILVFGRSDFVFEHGFSTFPSETLETTSKQPIPDEKNHLMIKLNGVKGDLIMTTAQLLYYNNESNILTEIPLQLFDETNKIYTAVDPFYPPDSVFKIAINGYEVKSNKTLRRLSRTTINNQKLPKGGETKPEIIFGGDSKHYVDYEKSIALKCIVIANPKPQIKWIEKITGTEKITPVQTIELLYKYVSFLQVENITKSSTYECRASNEIGQDNKTFSIEIERKSFFEIMEVPNGKTPLLIDCTVIQSSTYIFETCLLSPGGMTVDKIIEYKGEDNFICTVNSLPIANVTWYKNDDVITIDENHEISKNDSILTVKDMQPEVQGNYSCRVTNGDRDEIFPFSISISKVEEPKIRSGSTNETKKIGDIVVLHCKVDGVPTPKVKWFVGEKEILNDSRYSVDDKNTLSFTATVNDNKEFTCEAVNYYGKARKVDRIDVYEEPNIREGSTNETKKVGETVKLHCKVNGVPTPQVKWFADDKEILNSSRYVVNDENTLSFTATVNDSKEFICEAVNHYGKARKVDRIDVYGKTVILHCKVNGVPTPQVKWFVDDKEILNGSRFTATVNDSKEFVCEAVNHYGQTRKVDRIDVYEAPMIRDESTNDTKQVGETVILYCKVDGVPTPQVKWFVDDIEILNGSRYIVDDENTLSFTATVNDSKEFVCEAVNHYGQTRKVDRIDVYEAPMIRDESTNDTKQVGETVILHCKVNGVPTPQVKWFVDDKEILNGSRYVVDDENTLSFTATVNDSKEFVCEAVNHYGQTRKVDRIDVYEAPMIRDESTNDTKQVGETVILHCKVNGVPTPQVKWFVDDKEILNGSRYVVDDENTLSFTATVNDSKEFVCEAVNHYGQTRKVDRIDVYEAPMIRGESTNDTKQVGETVILYCKVDGVPTPQVKWFVDDIEILNGSRYVVDDENTLSFTATINDSKEFICEAVNHYGQARKVDRIDVYEIPEIDKNETQIRINETQKETITCRVARGFPLPTIEWRFNNKTMNCTSKNITLVNVKRTEAGVYTCIATNIYGNDEHDITVTVLYAPIIKGKEIIEIKARVGNLIKIDCDAEGEPTPNIKWFVNGTEITSDSRNIIHGNQLSIVHVEDDGEYICEAVNIFGKATKRVDLEVYEKPEINKTEHIKTYMENTKNVQISCGIIRGKPKPNVTWSLNVDSSLKAIAPIDIDTITYETIRRGRAGTYTCIATNEYGFDTHEIIVHVESPATAELTVSKILKISGEQIHLPCTADGIPQPIVEWYANDTKITSGGEYSIIHNHLRFTATIKNMGNYKCVSKNKHGGMNASVSVIVYVPVKIKSPESNRTKIEIFVNQDTQLTCQAESYPEAKYKWLFIGRSKKSESNHENSTEKGISTLFLKKLQSRHAGIYICNASNDYSFDTLSYEVDVLAPVLINKIKIKHAGEFIVGDTMAPLACEVVSGYPPPNITWTLSPNNDPIAQVVAIEGEPKRTFSKEDYDINLDGTLFIRNITINYDQNRYCCTVKNRLTSDVDNIVYTLDVSIVPEYAPPDNKESVRENTKYHIPCDIPHEEKDHIRWYKDDTEIINIGELNKDRIKLSDAGLYTCRVCYAKGGQPKTYRIELKVT